MTAKLGSRTMSDIKDDLDAVRVIVETLDSFSDEEKTRIIRWATEKLGMHTSIDQASAAKHPTPPDSSSPSADIRDTASARPDLKTFVAEKKPSNDVHFAATVAYFYAFEASPSERKTSIGSEELQNACRLTGRQRLQNPGQTLRNAIFRGFLDKGEERGQYRLNTVGENLVAVTLPGKPERKTKKRRPPTKKKTAKKAQKKKTEKKSSSTK